MRSLKTLWRTPSFTLPAIFCLSLGIAANTVMFGVLDTLLLRPLAHVEEPETLHRLAFDETYPGVGTVTNPRTSYPIYQELADGTAGLDSAGVFMPRRVSMGEGEGAREASAVIASRSFFDTLGTSSMLGRWFDASEAAPGSGATSVVLGHEIWRDEFGGTRSVLGQTVRIADRPYTVIGVAPRGFTGADMARVDLWLPLASLDHLMGPGWHQSRGSRLLVMVVRRGPGSAAEAVGAEMTASLQAAVPAGGFDPDPQASLDALSSVRGANTGSDVRVSIWLAGVALMVLLLALVNVTNLQLTRLLLRSREIAVRMALGAERGSLIRSLTAESLWLGLGGGLAAIPLVIWGGAFLRRVFLADLIGLGATLDLRLALWMMVITLVVGVSIVVIPALFAVRQDPATALPTGGEGGDRQRAPIRKLLLVAQVGLTFVLLAGAGIFLRSLDNARSVDLGLDLDRLLVASIEPRELSAETPWGIEELYARARDRVALMDGVETVAITAGLPLQSSFAESLVVPGVPDLSAVLSQGPYLHVVSPNYFEALGMELEDGRGFRTGEGRDDGERVVVVNRHMADLLWPDNSPLDRCIRIGGPEAPCSRVVGVVGNAQRGANLNLEPSAQYYLPLGQGPDWMRPAALLVRTEADPEDLVGSVRHELQALAPNLPFVRVRPLLEVMDRTLRPWRLGSSLLGVFGLVALAIAMFGTYGVVAYNVARRQYELGVRLALGARRSTIWKRVLLEGAQVGLWGILLGIGASLLAGRTVETLLYGVTPTDRWSLALAAVVLLIAVIGATVVPAFRAAKVNPVESLRVE